MSVEVKKEETPLRRPFLIAATRGDRTSPSLVSSDSINFIEPRTTNPTKNTFIAAHGGNFTINAPMAVVLDIFAAHGYAVYDEGALAALKKEHAAKKNAPQP